MPQNVYYLEDFKALKSDYSSMKNQHPHEETEDNDGIITKWIINNSTFEVKLGIISCWGLFTTRAYLLRPFK